MWRKFTKYNSAYSVRGGRLYTPTQNLFNAELVTGKDGDLSEIDR